MAGAVRQPINIQSLERYISKNVPEIKIPFDVKQVDYPTEAIHHDKDEVSSMLIASANSLASDNRILHTNSQPLMA